MLTSKPPWHDARLTNRFALMFTVSVYQCMYVFCLFNNSITMGGVEIVKHSVT